MSPAWFLLSAVAAAAFIDARCGSTFARYFLARAPSLPGRGAARDAAPLLPVASRTWHPALRLVWSAAPAMPAPYAERGC